MTVLPQLRAEVVAAVAAPRRRPRFPLVPALAAAAVAVTVAIVLLALPGSPPHEVPVPVAGTPPASQLSRYGVLRRAPTTDDRKALHLLREQMSPDTISRIREDYVRRLAPDLILYSLPVESSGLSVGRPRHDPLCLYLVSRGIGCWTAGELAAGESFANGDRRVGLVPDGVASVLMELDDGSRYVTEVHNNAYDMRVATPRGVAPGVTRVIWRDAQGRVVGP